MKERGGEGKEGILTFLPHPHLTLLFAPIFTQFVTLVPRSLLQNRTETLAMQAKVKYKTFVVKMSHICMRIRKKSFSNQWLFSQPRFETEA